MQQVEAFREFSRSDEAFFRMLFRHANRQDAVRMGNNQIAMRQSMQELFETLAMPPQPREPPVQMTFQIPVNWEDAVPVAPTGPQVQHALITAAVSNPPQTCAICQESIHSDGVQLRNCQHNQHRHCILQWFGTSPRCPVCRNDIREGSQQ